MTAFWAPSRYGFKEGTIFRARGGRSRDIEPGSRATFDLVFDGTDHFSFQCHGCRSEARAEEVKAIRTESPTLYFDLRCTKCGALRTRKVYLYNP